MLSPQACCSRSARLLGAHRVAVTVRRLTAGARAIAELETTLAGRLAAARHPSLPGTLADYGAEPHVTVEPGAAPGAPPAIRVSLATLSAASPAAAAVRQTAQNLAAAAAGVDPSRVSVSLRPAAHADESFTTAGPGLAGVGSAIAVSSGKGGVGKSTVAVNLTFALSRLGARTALLDADIHGPSLPTMVTPASLAVHKSADGRSMNALHADGVACMSYGWVAPRNARGERTGAVMRGPMLSQVLSQLLRFTAWGAADHLVIDTPPGTGDAHITLGQALPLAGAVIVTTPAKLALVDVAKGLDMYAALQVQPLAVVLNMAHFDVPEGGTAPQAAGAAGAGGYGSGGPAPGWRRYYPFGNGEARVRELMASRGIDPSCLFTLPIEPATAEAGDSGRPAVLTHPDSATAAAYAALAAHVAGRVEGWMGERCRRKAAAAEGTGGAGQLAPVSVAFDAGRKALVVRDFRGDGAREVLLHPASVRRACRCAACVDEVTGEQRLKPERVREDTVPTRVEPKGNYGVAISWSDGHASSIFTFTQLLGMQPGASPGAAPGS